MEYLLRRGTEVGIFSRWVGILKKTHCNEFLPFLLIYNLILSARLKKRWNYLEYWWILEGGFFFLKEERAVKKWYFCQIFRHKCRKELKSKTFRNTPPSPSSTQNGAVNPPLIWVFCKREIEQQTNFHFMGSFVLFIISSILSYRFYYKQNKKKKLIDWTKENLRVFLNLRVVK